MDKITHETEDVVLSVKEIRKTYRGKHPVSALKSVSFEVRKGDIVGYLGPNGSGKTTTINILLGLAAADEGTFSITSDRVGFILDSPSLYPQLTFRENLLFYCGMIHADLDSAMQWIERVGLSDVLDQKLSEFSLGMKKRAEIVRVLLNNPDLIFLDEPFSGLDPFGQRNVREELTELTRSGATLFITGHDLYNIHQMCNRFLFLDRGKLISQMDIASLKSAKELEDYYVETYRTSSTADHKPEH